MLTNSHTLQVLMSSEALQMIKDTDMFKNKQKFIYHGKFELADSEGGLLSPNTKSSVINTLKSHHFYRHNRITVV